MEDSPGPRGRNRSLFGIPWHFVKMALWTPVRALDYAIRCIFRMYLYIYRKIVGRYPKFLVNYNNSKEDAIQVNNSECNARISRANEDVVHAKEELNNLNEEMRRMGGYMKRLESDLSKEDERMQTMSEEKYALECDKQDLLRRLSEHASVRLRDNNPNIVDLNDQYRPTKVAEMFSELYNDEWTDAYDILKKAFTEEQIIVILLDLVMEAYGFCEDSVAEPWTVLTNWFLYMKMPGAQQTAKWLKDSRKANIKNKVPEVEKDYGMRISAMCGENELREYLSQICMKSYMTKCIELCLLMVTSDPPVVLVCPGWIACDLIESRNQQSTNAGGEDRTMMQKQQERTTTDEESTSENIANGKQQFDKEVFKEYTSRGEYLDYIVWPALYLHNDGSLLVKGIAQGSKTQYREADDITWTWRRTNYT